MSTAAPNGGSSRAVRDFCLRLEVLLDSAGLSLQPSKCVIVPAAGLANRVPSSAFPAFAFLEAGDFKLLGSPFGSPEFCNLHTRKRAQKAEELLAKVAGMEDVQSALLLTRHCTSFSKLVFPPALCLRACTRGR